MAGGREMLARPGERSRELAWDDVRAADPDVLLLACCGQDVPRTLDDLRHLESKPGFVQMKAVRTGRVFVADGGAYFSRPGPRLVDSLELLAETLHPSSDPLAKALPAVDDRPHRRPRRRDIPSLGQTADPVSAGRCPSGRSP